MRTLWMFYPENDVALANGSPRFTAPKNAEQLRRDCSYLLNWVAKPGDSVVYEALDPAWETAVRDANFPAVGRFDSSLTSEIDRVVPWGWSAAVKHRLLKMGVPERLLPSDERIERIRSLSHRRSSVEINRRLRDAGIAVPPLPVEVRTVAELADAVAEGRWMVKSPWSSSGRGVVDTASLRRDELLRRAEGLLRHQGSLLVEPYLDKVRDFAMLFEASGEGVKFAGLSLFENANGTAYSANLVAPQSELRRRISELVPISAIDRIARELETILSAMLEGVYTGYCGVDMMVYDDGGLPAVAPCVELNLRMTMGVVAMLIAERHHELATPSLMTMAPSDYDLALTPPGCRFRFGLVKE